MTTYPDDLGLNQTRVLDTANRNFESVIYQRKKPPLSCEVNLTGELASTRAQDIYHATSPSGWVNVGSIKDDALENLALSGDVLCSSAYARNSFKLIAKDKGAANGQLQAWVNGMKVVVEGTTSTDENNIITLPNPSTSGSAVDFVFLEVWRKLITPSDVIYKNGNILYTGLDNPANDLIDPAIDIETSLRIQVQYRIRVAEVDIENYPSGFSPMVFLQGPLTSPLSGSNYFSPVPGDPGLWRAGAGDPEAQTQIGTVDGYTYAIPMFAIARRNTTPYDPASASNGSGRTLANYLAGIASDRPDNKYNDFIVADDILDMRCRSIPVENTKEICEKAFNKLLGGKLRSKMSRSFLGQDHYGVTLTQVDSIHQTDNAWSDPIGVGDPSPASRRVFANAGVDQPFTLYQQTTSVLWETGDYIPVSVTAPADAIIKSVENVYVTGANKSVPLYPMPYVVISNYDAMVSTDEGLSWYLHATGASFPLNAVIVANIIVAVGDNGTIMTSLDGETWVAQTSGITDPLLGLAWNVDRFVAVGYNYILSSEDGITWTTRAAPPINIKGVVWGNDGSGGGLFVAVGDNYILTSNDGLLWSLTPGPSGGNYNAIIWDGRQNDQYVVVGDAGFIMTSPDGSIWTSQTSGVFDDLRSVAWGTSGSYVVVGNGGTILTSGDGANWTIATSGTVYNLSSVAWTGNQSPATNQYIVAGIYSGTPTFLTSPDGSTWTPQTVPLTTDANGISCGNISIAYLNTSTINGNIISSNLNKGSITFDYTVHYPKSSNGFTKLPTKVLEFREEGVDTSSIASINADIRVRSAPPLILGPDTTRFTTLSNRSGNCSELFDFGHQMVYHDKGSGIGEQRFNRDLYGYNILGIASLYDGTILRNLSDVTRTPTQYIVKSYGGEGVFPLNHDITLKLYTEGKFFQTSKQGRGIVDTFEMKEYETDQTATGALSTFTIDSTNRAILKLASNTREIGANGACIAYVRNGANEIQTYLTTNNKKLPTDCTRSRAVIEFSVPPVNADNGTTVIVPTLINSAIEFTEGYACFYETLPYQGFLTSSCSGQVEAEGPAVTTTAGSGAITDTVIGPTNSSIDFVLGSSTLTIGSGNWLSTIRPGYIINPGNTNPKEQYKILSVDSDTQITLVSPIIVNRTSVYYNVISMDRANFNRANIIDQLPTLLGSNDSAAINDMIETGYAGAFPEIETRIVSRVQDVTESIIIGLNSADRGRSTVKITGDDTLGLGNLGLRFENLTSSGEYQKTYQSYAFNKDSSGEMYLMVVGTETDNSGSVERYLNQSSNSDTVDLFRMPGRPLTIRRTV